MITFYDENHFNKITISFVLLISSCCLNVECFLKNLTKLLFKCYTQTFSSHKLDLPWFLLVFFTHLIPYFLEFSQFSFLTMLSPSFTNFRKTVYLEQNPSSLWWKWCHNCRRIIIFVKFIWIRIFKLLFYFYFHNLFWFKCVVIYSFIQYIVMF